MDNNRQDQGNYQKPDRQPFLPSYDVNAYAILALVMGIMGVTSDGGLAGGVLAIIFSEMARRRLRIEDELGRRFTKAALILGVVAIGLFVLGIIGEMLGYVLNSWSWYF